MTAPIPTFSRTEDISLSAKGTLLNLCQRYLYGPLDFVELVGSASGNGVELSVDGQTWTTLRPGESLSDMRGVEAVTLRNPRTACGDRYRVRYGMGSIEKSRDGTPFIDGVSGVPFVWRFDDANSLTPVPLFAGMTAVGVFPLTSGLVEYDHTPTLRNLHAFNTAGHTLYLCLRWHLDGTDANRPVPAVNKPHMIFAIPAGGSVSEEWKLGIKPGIQMGATDKAPFAWASKDGFASATPLDALTYLGLVATVA